MRNRGFGVLSTEVSVETLVYAACLVASGGIYIDAVFRPAINQSIEKAIDADLSRREKLVLQLIAQGYSTKEVADILKLSGRFASLSAEVVDGGENQCGSITLLKEYRAGSYGRHQ